jgi:hypothetical protein
LYAATFFSAALDSTGITNEVEKFLKHQTGEPFELAPPFVASSRRMIPGAILDDAK